MDRFPTEILLQIASHLAYTDKVNFKSTCRVWYEIVRSADLYGQFRIQGTELFEACKRRFESCPNQVRSLCLEDTDAKIAYVLALPEIFPNLQKIIWEDGSDDQKVIVNKAIAEFWKKISSFGETSFYSLATEILKYGGFSNLIELKVDFCSSDDSEVHLLIPQLSKAPNLKRLKFENTDLSSSDLRELHRNAPHLEALHFCNITLTDGVQMIENPISARGLTDLVMTGMKNETLRNRGWMREFAKVVNYGDLKQLRITSECTDSSIGSQLAMFITGCPDLESCRAEFYETDYNGYRTKTLDTSLAWSANCTNKIALKKIEIGSEHAAEELKQLLNSAQKYSLETIVVFQTHYDMDNRREFYKRLQGFENLKHLEILDASSFPLNAILRNLKHLETLKLEGSKSEFPQFDPVSEDVEHKNLKNLTILAKHAITKDDTLMPFLSKYCPALSNLSIVGYFNTKKVCHMNFPNHTFTSIILNGLGENYYKVENARETTVRWFATTKTDVSNINSPEYLLQSSLPKEDKPYLSIKYKYCGNLKIETANASDWYDQTNKIKMEMQSLDSPTV